MIIVHEQTGAEAVARAQVLLELEEIAAADEVIRVGVRRQFRDVDVVVLRIDGFEKPELVADDRAGEAETRLESIEANAVQVAEEGMKFVAS